MRSMCLIALCLLVLVTSASHAQSPSTFDVPEPCRDVKPDVDSLERRKQRLEQEIAAKNTALSTATDSLRKSLQEELRNAQEALVGVVFEIECAGIKRRVRQTPVRQRRAAHPAAQKAVAITTYFATNRKRSGVQDPANFYDLTDSGTVEYGRAIVSIPLSHTPGDLELPSLWKLERRPDPNKHFVVKAVNPLHVDAALQEISQTLQVSPGKAVLLFVHGYNTTFQDAAMRTAQLAHDLKFAGIPFFFSWPSAGRPTSYLRDTDTAELSERHFVQLLDHLSRLPATDLYIIAHSMGNRIVTRGVRARVEKRQDTSKLKELLLAAPDINADLFRTQIAPALAQMRGTRTTVYASSKDLALRASSVLHEYSRLGDTYPNVFVHPRIETIDASGVSLLNRGYGHTYIMDSQAVLNDINLLLQRRVSAKDRGLSEVGKVPDLYWKFP